MLGRGDQRPGRDAWDRYRDLEKEWAVIEAMASKIE
jgi:hypothetical protein